MPHSYRIPSSFRHLFKQSEYCYLKLFLTRSRVRAFHVLGSFPSPDIIYEYGRIHNVWSLRPVHLAIESGTFECHVSIRSPRKDFKFAQTAVPLLPGCLLFWIQSRMNNSQDLILCIRVGATPPPSYSAARPSPPSSTPTERMGGRTSTPLGISLSQPFPDPPALATGHISFQTTPSTGRTVLSILPTPPGPVQPQTGLAHLRAIDIINAMFSTSVIPRNTDEGSFYDIKTQFSQGWFQKLVGAIGNIHRQMEQVQRENKWLKEKQEETQKERVRHGQLIARTLSRINIADSKLENLETATRTNSERINAVTKTPLAEGQSVPGLEELRDKVIKLTTMRTVQEETMKIIAGNLVEEGLTNFQTYLEENCPHCAHCQCRIQLQNSPRHSPPPPVPFPDTRPRTVSSPALSYVTYEDTPMLQPATLPAVRRRNNPPSEPSDSSDTEIETPRRGRRFHHHR